MGTASRRRAEVRELLRYAGVRLEDLPEHVRDSEILGYAKRLPPEMRAEYFEALVEFFRIYEQRDEAGRAEMLERFEETLNEEFARKRWDH
jgi:hypothetical protein